MVSRPPTRNLPPDSEAWGRYVEGTLGDLARDTVQNSQSASNGLAATNGALQQLAGQVNTLAGVVAALPVSNILTSVVTNFQAGNGLQTRTSVVFSVPPGKTNVSVLATMQGFYLSDFSVPMSNRAAFRITTSGGYTGPWASMSPDNMDSYWVSGNGGVQHTGIGSSLTVSIQSSAGPTLAPAYTENQLNLFALAIFT